MAGEKFTGVVTPGMRVENLDTCIASDNGKGVEGAFDTLHECQRRLLANRRYGVLLVIQGLDAAGKDSLIRTVAQTMDPAGFRSHSFRRPVGEEVHHDFLWRVWRHLPERGEVVAFNRSHYESVLAERLWPLSEHASDAWAQKYQSINAFEQHLHREGIRIIKIWLNTSHEEQRRRLLKRLDTPRKCWKFDDADLMSWKARDDYLQLVNEVLPATHTKIAPWYVIPNDDKRAARLAVAAILADTLKALAPAYPREDPACIARYRALLQGEGSDNA